MQGLQLLELREQYQDRMDYSKCVESLDIVEVQDDLMEDDILINETDNLSSAAVNSTENDLYSESDNEDIYEYNIVFDTIDDVPAVEAADGGHQQNCDQTSCQVEVNNDSNNDDRPGFFGSITKLLQPLFTLDL